MNQSIVSLWNEQFRIPVMIRQRDLMDAHIGRRGPPQQSRHLVRRFECMHLFRQTRQLPRVEAAIRPDIHGHRVFGNNFAKI